MKKKLIVLFLMMFLSYSLSGCFLFTIGPSEDPMLQWFDVTEYNQELWNMCYGDGYVNYVPGDPYTCPRYTEEEVTAKLVAYMESFDLTYSKLLGRAYLVNFTVALNNEFTSLFTDEEAISRLNGVLFTELLAYDEDGNEKLVYLPEYVPIGSDVKAFIYDFPVPFTFSRYVELVNTYLGTCEEFVFTSRQVNASNQVMTEMIPYKVCISDSLVDDVQYLKDTSVLSNIIHFEAVLEAYKWEDDSWVEATGGFKTYITYYAANKVQFICFTGWNTDFDPQYDTIFEFTADW